ncbi:hypothetical protein P9A16_31685 [Shinella sp. 838]|uniref:hypothetical protein n=1 Tax=Shinella sp. 838 TaxID=3038164 RepID=UPI00241574D8|nr:hypothetical protein [Shinella sp. 838]MDG4675664.1 hypothetical protein [Shinella sp. 838]
MRLNVQEEIDRLASGDKDALDLIHGAWKACSVWDDLIDKDNVPTEQQINDCFLWALFDLQNNRVYRENPHLAFVLRLTISNWFAANRLEREEEREKRITAYTLRCSPYDFFVAVIMCVAGPSAADEAAYLFRSMNTTDNLEDYLSEHTKD